MSMNSYISKLFLYKIHRNNSIMKLHSKLELLNNNIEVKYLEIKNNELKIITQYYGK